MSAKIIYTPNQIINGLVFIRETEPYINPKTKVETRKALFKCFCGNEFETHINRLKSGHASSCGCFRSFTSKENNSTHGLSKHPLYKVREGMKARCLVITHHAYARYGGRGIKICDEWLNDFKAFYDWAIANGYEQGLQIDRINNDGNYEPSNCRFVTPKVNIRNQSTTKLDWKKVNEIRKLKRENPKTTLIQISGMYGVHFGTVSDILNNKIWI